MNINCIPYEATMSLAVCQSRKKAAVAGDGLTNRKCLDCKEGGSVNEEKSGILTCKTCGFSPKEGEKFNYKHMECKKCYGARWIREKKAKMKLAPPEAATSDKPEPVRKVKTKPANGNNAVEKINNEIARLNEELRILDESASVIRHELGIYEKVRELLG